MIWLFIASITKLVPYHGNHSAHVLPLGQKALLDRKALTRVNSWFWKNLFPSFQAQIPHCWLLWNIIYWSSVTFVSYFNFLLRSRKGSEKKGQWFPFGKPSIPILYLTLLICIWDLSVLGSLINRGLYFETRAIAWFPLKSAELCQHNQLQSWTFIFSYFSVFFYWVVLTLCFVKILLF